MGRTPYVCLCHQWYLVLASSISSVCMSNADGPWFNWSMVLSSIHQNLFPLIALFISNASPFYPSVSYPSILPCFLLLKRVEECIVPMNQNGVRALV
ncbi:hypothetical protein BKA57DRAFT_462175 [Linnemannia elongata]|nr:hypothetical protein BKA57DRAFT_462175 [Linnemannia elongata]